MKQLYLAAFSVTSVTATGALLVVTGTEIITVFAVQSAIGAETPIDGITIGVVFVGIIAGLGFLWTGAKHLLALGAYIARLTETVNTSQATAETLRKVTDRLENLDARLREIEHGERRHGND